MAGPHALRHHLVLNLMSVGDAGECWPGKQGTEPSALDGYRILIAEDNLFAAMELEQYLVDLGCRAVGPAATVNEALRLAKEEMLEGALLDLNLRDQSALPVARELSARGIPLILVTGYDDAGIPEELAPVPRMHKPFLEGEVKRLMLASFCP
jgi:CheY-like chemotaxis protein